MWTVYRSTRNVSIMTWTICGIWWDWGQFFFFFFFFVICCPMDLLITAWVQIYMEIAESRCLYFSAGPAGWFAAGYQVNSVQDQFTKNALQEHILHQCTLLYPCLIILLCCGLIIATFMTKWAIFTSLHMKLGSLCLHRFFISICSLSKRVVCLYIKTDQFILSEKQIN